MIPSELVIAGIAAVAVLTLFIGLAARPPQDAVQQRLSQLVVQPKTLEEAELDAPFYERVVRPLIKRLSRVRKDNGGMMAKAEARL
jgi:hypothetical protein